MYLYVFKMLDMFKVGVSNDPESRAAYISSMTPITIDICKTIKLPKRSMAFKIEGLIHKDLASLGFHIKGEWFSCELREVEASILRSLKKINKSKKEQKKSKLKLAEEAVAHRMQVSQIAKKAKKIFQMLDKESQRIVIRHKRDSEKSFDEYLEKAINGEVSMAKIISTLEKIKKLSDYIEGKFNV